MSSFARATAARLPLASLGLAFAPLASHADNGATSRQAECASLDGQIKQYDAMARRPRSGQMQDWVTEQKRKARKRQCALKR